MKIGLQRCLLRLESSMHILLRFFWRKQWHGVHVFHFLKVLIDVILESIPSQMYKLHGFVPNLCEIYYFMGSYHLHTNVMHYLNTEVVCMTFVCKIQINTKHLCLNNACAINVQTIQVDV
jgi:hypothetical protein